MAIIGLGGTEFTVNEQDGVVVVPITRFDDPAVEVLVDFQTVPISAAEGADYIGTRSTVTFAPGETVKQITVPILNDTLAEGTEAFSFVIERVLGGTLGAPRTARVQILDDEAPSTGGGGGPGVPGSAFAVTATDFITGLTQPVTLQWVPGTPDTILVAEKGGLIKAYQNGAVLPTPFLDLQPIVNNAVDRGVLDLELDPDFATNHYVYVYYVYDPPETATQTGLAAPDGGGNRTARLVRYEADPATGFTTAVPGSEKLLVGSNGTFANISGPGVDSTVDLAQPPSGVLPDGSFLQDYIAVDSLSHAGGDIEFGPDGALYLSIGDGGSYNALDVRNLRVQDINSLNGKILRLDKETGQGLPDNPFFGISGGPDSNAAKVYQLGLRNPFRIDIDENTGQVWIGEVGWSNYEEINAGLPGANFGWPYYEGVTGVGLPQPNYAALPQSQAFYNSGLPTIGAIRSFAHTADAGETIPIQAVIAGEIYDGDAYPGALRNTLFFADFLKPEVYYLDLNQPVPQVGLLGSVADGIVDMVQGPDGRVYAADLFDGRIVRIDVTAPVAAAAPGEPFDAGATAGPDDLLLA